MTVPARVSLVTLGVADVERAARFYEALGWRRSSASVAGEVAFFQLGPNVLALYDQRRMAADAGLEAATPAFRGAAASINLATEAEVDAAFGEFVAAGALVRSAPARAAWGGYIAQVSDPDGHLWELAYNPGFALGADGAVRLPG